MVTARPAMADGTHVLIIGGGASGVLLATQLLRRGRGRVAVTILEKRAMLGCGLAYSTADPRHVLNTRVANMSAYPDLPDHFLEWLRTDGGHPADPQGFVPRRIYGRYMQALLDPWSGDPALTCEQAECVRLEMDAQGVVAHLSQGRRVAGDLAVLATGHALPGPDEPPGLSQPWTPFEGPAEGEVLMVGSGLTMVDQVLSLLARGHAGRITAVSRRGLIPQVHRPTAPVAIRAEELPRPLRVSTLMRWLRRRARAQEATGGDWRDVVDGLRPHLQAIWQDLPLASRRSFLRHAATHWEAHRHRMPPDSGRRLRRAMDEGRFRLVRGRFDRVEAGADGGLLARIVDPDGRPRTQPVGSVIDCRGTRRDPETHATPLVAHLLATGAARIDPLRLGLDVAPDCRVRDAAGATSGRLFALGPASRAAFWEITAIPDIRSQAATLAETILAEARSTHPARRESRDGRASDIPPAAARETSPRGPEPGGGEEPSPPRGARGRGALPGARSLEWPAPPGTL